MINNKLKKTISLSIALIAVMGITPITQAHAEWKKDNVGWWYANGNSYDTGWNNIGGTWYYFDNSGYMKTGWIKDGGSWYYLYTDGSMAHDTTIDGYLLGKNGQWIDTSNLSSTNAKANIDFKIPSTWTKKTNSGLDQYILDSKGTNVSIISENMQGYSIEDYNKYSEINVKKYFKIDNIRSNDLQINGYKARMINYNYTLNGQNIEIYQVLIYNKGTAYIFTIGGVDEISSENIDSFAEMISTVSFK